MEKTFCHLGTTYLNHKVKFLCLFRQRRVQTDKLRFQVHKQTNRNHLYVSLDNIICKLRKINMIIRMNNTVITFLIAQKLNSADRDNLIRVHVEGCPGANLNRGNDKCLTDFPGRISISSQVLAITSAIFYDPKAQFCNS